MEWEPEAKAAIDRAPFFVRRFARRKVEEQVQAEGRRRVTLADVRRVKETVGRDGPNPLAPFPARERGTTEGPPLPLGEGWGDGSLSGVPRLGGETEVTLPPPSMESVAESADDSVLTIALSQRERAQDASPHPNPLPEGEGTSPLPFREGGKGVRSVSNRDGGLGLSPSLESTSGLTEDQIRMIERLVDQIPGQESRYWTAKSCGGAVGCPLTLVDARAASDAVIAAIERSGLSEAQAARLSGPVLSHHRFKAAVAGCPNCCSEPQIKNFALVARARPRLGPGDCIQCGSCEAECKEGAVSIATASPVFDPARCVGCGACAEVCETEAVVKSVGYDVLVGGRLGRKPRLATAIAEGVRLDEGIALLDRCLDLVLSEGLPGERLGALLDRVGWESLGVRDPGVTS